MGPKIGKMDFPKFVKPPIISQDVNPCLKRPPPPVGTTKGPLPPLDSDQPPVDVGHISSHWPTLPAACIFSSFSFLLLSASAAFHVSSHYTRAATPSLLRSQRPPTIPLHCQRPLLHSPCTQRPLDQPLGSDPAATCLAPAQRPHLLFQLTSQSACCPF